MSVEQAEGAETSGDNPSNSSDILQKTARSSVLSFAGALISGLAGFGLSFILGRTVGPEGSGVVFQMISVFMIASGVAKLGLDTTCVWLLPRLAIDGRDEVRRATTLLLVGSLAGGVAAGVAVFLLAPILSAGDSNLLSLIRAVGVSIPIASVGTVALAVTRGLGGIRPYVLIGSVGLPTARLVAVAVAVAITASALLAGYVWLALLLVATIASLEAVRRRLRPFVAPGPDARSRRALVKQISSYSGPRLASSIMEQAVLWQDVLIVGLVAGPAVAGVYGVVSRLAQAGFIPSTSMRIVVGPEFSRMLHQNQVAELANFYTRTTQWIALMSAPIYVLFVVDAGPILRIFGAGFEVGDLALIIMSLGALIWTSAGNVQSLLLMSGHSGWAALNKLGVLIVNLALLLVLVPGLGLEGAAYAWTTTMILDVVLAIVVVRRAIGVRLNIGATLLAVMASTVSTAVPALAARLLLGDTLLAFLIGAVAAGVTYLAALYLLRNRFELQHAISLFTRRRRNKA